MSTSPLNRTSPAKWLLGFVLLVVAGISGWMFFTNGKWSKDGNLPIEKGSFQELSLAAAYLENAEFSKALAIFQKAEVSDPSNTVLKKNLAVAIIANIKAKVNELSNPDSNAVAIRESLPGMLDQAQSAINTLIASRPEDPVGYQLDVELELERIGLTDEIIADELRESLLKRMDGYLERFPGNQFLAIRNDELLESLSNALPNKRGEAIAPLWKAYEANPRNLLLIQKLVQLLGQREDSRVFELLEPMLELLRPFEWQIAPNKLTELESVRTLQVQDAEQARFLMTQWANILKQTTGFSEDVKRTFPNPLALFDFSDLQRVAVERPRIVSNSKVQFNASLIPSHLAQGVIALDWDVDTKKEIVSWAPSQLTLGRLEEQGNFQILSTLAWDEEKKIRGIQAVDLYEVDYSARTRTKSVNLTAQQASRHDTVRDLLVFGDFGLTTVAWKIADDPMAKPEWYIDARDIGLSDLKGVSIVLPLDWEADGDLDLFVVADGKVQLRQNSGARKMMDANEWSLLPPVDTKIYSAVVVDIDRDVDLDVVMSTEDGIGVLENILHGQFHYQAWDERWASLAKAKQLQVGEFDGNFSWDLVAQNDTGTTIALTATSPGESVVPKRITSFPNQGDVCVLQDFDNDGYLDIITTSLRGQLDIHKNDSTGAFENSSASVVSDNTIQDAFLFRANAFDVNGDGLLDLVSSVGDKLCYWKNETIQAGSSFSELRLRGVSDPNGGGRINHYCVGSVIEVFGANGYQARVVEDDSVFFGFGSQSPSSIRIIFVNGLTQNVISPTKGLIEEIQVPKGSCPFIYGWDGSEWKFITDGLWNAPLGLQQERGRPIPDRNWEFLYIEGNRIQSKNGSYEVRITEELWEAAYLDRVALGYFDRPANGFAYSNEKVGPPQLAEPGIWIGSRKIAPKKALDKYGKDWTESLTAEDKDYALPFQKRVRQGIVENHFVELDFGPIERPNDAQLYLTGWIYPTDTSINIGVDQNPEVEPARPPSLWVVGGQGDFVEAIPFTGFPGGKPKTIAIPLTGVFLSEDHRIRIQTSSEIYWDRAFIGYGEFHPMTKESNSTVSYLSLQEAKLVYRGFSQEKLGHRSQPHDFDYNRVSQLAKWPPMAGKFTNYGNVKPILEMEDHHLVVLASGDELRLSFSSPATPVSDGFIRDWILHSVGWDKDADLNTLEGQSSLPLPFAQQHRYPSGAEQSAEQQQINQLHQKTLQREVDKNSFWKGRGL